MIWALFLIGILSGDIDYTLINRFGEQVVKEYGKYYSKDVTVGQDG